MMVSTLTKLVWTTLLLPWSLADHGRGMVEEAEADDGSNQIRILTFDYPGFDLVGMEKNAKNYFEKTGVSVVYEKVADFFGLQEEIRSQAENRLPLYDGYICAPSVVGSVAQYEGWVDLTETVRTRDEIEWQDMLLGIRETVAVWDNKVYMLPLDGDAHFLFYREDILQAFGLTVPRTWDEYWQVAKAVHGQEFEGKTLSGSCIGRQEGFQNSYWLTLVLSSYTQTRGPSQGHLFDPTDMTPLAGEALAETIKMIELQATYGHPLEFEMHGGGGEHSVNLQAMNNGTCVLTYNWGDSFKAGQSPDSAVKDKMKVAQTPGSTRVYNRMTKKLEPCTEDLCGGPSGEFHEDIGWVNRAAYLAFGGWSAAVNNNINDVRKKQTLDFLVYMNSPKVSLEDTILAPGTPANQTTGVDPYRSSHLDPALWAAQGYEKASAQSYASTIKETFRNPNLVLDHRFSGADRIAVSIDSHLSNYLSRAVIEKSLPVDEEARQLERLKVADAMAEEFREIIADEDSKPESLIPVLSQYQLALGIYKPPYDHKDIGGIRVVGWMLAATVIACSVAFALWVAVKRETRVIKVSAEMHALNNVLPFLGRLIIAPPIFLLCCHGFLHRVPNLASYY
ncbi:Bacterial extracellular solute-binding protein [Seminavis robusta]|uniref:Bacterial extracellular solute-binding protein n=1 Tax=Seminavis robusta TaxID=568900 RepID=A0A9N8DGB6_9STRA|nr:Bacterial extracellular solute-binding protein [Seminavis robusta]|eukprot:Sro144_g066860.1 Bacterial extracellular solute-binding protein (620) ;mRNA; f:10459-12586